MVVRTSSALVFACHSSACRPPTAGGTGGSSSSGSARRNGKQADGSYAYGDYKVRYDPKPKKWVITRPDGGTNTASTLKRAKLAVERSQQAQDEKQRNVDAVKRGVSSIGLKKPTTAGTDRPFPKNVAEARETQPGTPGYKPRKMTKEQANAEMDEYIRDSENHGYSPDSREAEAWLGAFNTMRATGKDAAYKHPYSRYDDDDPEVVRKGETQWDTKLDYEVSFPADTVAAWLGKPLKD